MSAVIAKPNTQFKMFMCNVTLFMAVIVVSFNRHDNRVVVLQLSQTE